MTVEQNCSNGEKSSLIAGLSLKNVELFPRAAARSRLFLSQQLPAALLHLLPGGCYGLNFIRVFRHFSIPERVDMHA
jgi:hypothetical protein